MLKEKVQQHMKYQKQCFAFGMLILKYAYLTSLRNQPYYRILACETPSSQLGLLHPSQAGGQFWSQYRLNMWK